jgi:hypothetical protein
MDFIMSAGDKGLRDEVRQLVSGDILMKCDICTCAFLDWLDNAWLLWM